jgi:hypothetical protein
LTIWKTLDEIVATLTADRELSPNEAEQIVRSLDGILRDKNTSQEVEDDAWYTLDVLRPRHEACAPYLCRALARASERTTRDSRARLWALRAIERVGAVDQVPMSCLEELALPPASFCLDIDTDLRSEAKRVLAGVRRSSKTIR